MGTSRSRSFLVCLLTGIVWTPFATSLAAAVAAQSAADIFDEMLGHQRQRLSAIESLLIEQETMGVSTTLYMVKEVVDGEPMLVPRMTVVGGDDNARPGE